jgi:hypothetical protein
MNTPSPVLKTASSSLPVGTRLAEFEITGVIGEGASESFTALMTQVLSVSWP